ncbi:MAG: hypothetical protein LBT94_00165 [Prevotellaceae bacterium]|jgi:hypothetical protein|nr:hypothetical protein [Prevotellaceae bacterium]
MTTTIQAYYNGTAFVPAKLLDIQKGEVVTLSISQDSAPTEDAAQKLMIFKRITNNLCKLNDATPLSPEFDTILSQRVRLKEMTGL